MDPVILDPAHNDVSAANAPAVVTLDAINYRRRRIVGLDWGYSDDPTNGSIQIEDGEGNVVWGPMPITSGGPGSHRWENGIEGSFNTQMIVTLAAGGSGITGALKVHVSV